MTCPCKTKLTDEQKTLFNSPIDPIKNVVGEKAASISSSLTNTIGKAQGLVDLFNVAPGAPITGLAAAMQNAGLGGSQLNGLVDRLNSLKNTTDVFKAEADRLSDPQNLMSLVGTMNFYGNIGCALGIEGIDVGVSLSVVTEGGKTSIAVAGNIQADIDRMLDNVMSGTDIEAAMGELSSQMNNISGQIDGAVGQLNGMVDMGKQKFEEAMAKVAEFTQVSFLSNLVGDGTDPCNKMAVEVAGSLLSQEFKQLSRSAISSVAAKTTLGEGFR